MSAITRGVTLHEVRAEIPDDPDARASFDYRIKALTWEQMLTANGVRRVILVNELGERGVNIEMRVNLTQLRKRIPGATELAVMGPHPQSIMPNSRYPEVPYRFTEEWQPQPAFVAFWFHQACQFKPELGAAYTDDGYYRQRTADGEFALNWRPINRAFLPGILEFRAPADKLKDGPVSAGGIVLTRVQPRLSSLPSGAELELLPIEDEADTSALDELAPPATRASVAPPADTVADDVAELAKVIERQARRSPARRPTETPPAPPVDEEYQLPTADDVPPIPRA